MKRKKEMLIASDYFTFIGILLLGILVTVFIYPLLHEGGHFLTAYLIGADIVDIELLPIPFVMCNIAELTRIQQFFIGISGMFLPLIIAVLMPHKQFWSWYIRFLLLDISLLAFGISAVTISSPNGEVFNPQDDMLYLLSLWAGTGTKKTFIVLLGISMFFIIVLTFMDRPLERIYSKFGIKKSVK